ncbi:NADH-ubiquinone dehydrogenase [Phyllobacterium sp. LjRoot231]|uniref:NADH-ubiquinone dehydrogenase n=1 Tax=Phyllobacterium sp. LjRoot231 TaxID=3342289 RepID=UPI003ECD08ED
MPKQTIPAANLLTPPLGAAAVVSALGLGMASQIWGFWAGAMASAFDMNTKLKPVMWQPHGADPQPSPDIDTLKTIIRKTAGTVKEKAPILARNIPAKEMNASIATNSSAHTIAPASPIAADDLKRISGIGPKLEQVLKGMGIRTYVQIAAWTADDIAKVDDQLKFGGRISRDDWVGQASKLAAEGQK